MFGRDRFVFFLTFVVCLWAASPASAQSRINFLSVSLGDAETREADRALRDYIELAFAERGITAELEARQLGYRAMIDRLASWQEGAYLARATPYVAVVARMLGAQFDVIGTYVSRTTNRRVYHSYFVLNRNTFSESGDLDGLVRYLRNRSEPATFIYHDQFSTSSYFLPSLYFKDNGIYDTDFETLTAIHGRHIEVGGSTDAARMVARNPSMFAAVWDGTKAKFDPGGSEYTEYGPSLRFIQLPTPLPNDLLIACGLGEEHLSAIDTAIARMRGDTSRQIRIGDFELWEPIRMARDAREAFATLSQLAATTPPFVTVRIRADSVDPVPPAHLAAARQAVRFSGSEFVVYDADYHERADFEWVMSAIHDGAVLLQSKVQDYDRLAPQEFRMSFSDEVDLTKRITALIHSRVHRIRYVWPYLPDKPTVVRDVDFAIDSGTAVMAQQIAWQDPLRNQFELMGIPFNLEVMSADYHRFEFEGAGLEAATLDPLSNLAYRVVLERPLRESTFMRFLTYTFVVLLVAAAGGAVVDLRRRGHPGIPGGTPHGPTNRKGI